VTTAVNLISLICHLTGLDLKSAEAGYTKEEYCALISQALEHIELLSKWSADDPAVNEGSPVMEDCAEQFIQDDLFSDAEQGDEVEPEQPDSMMNFHKDMTFYGILMLAQKSASQFGDGEAALAMWKNSITDYNDTNKPKYRICCHRKIAACAGVFGAKIQTDALHNCYINDRGFEDSNVEGDLKVEHINCEFKAALMNLCGNYSEDALYRIAKSLDITKCLQEKLIPQFVDSEDPLQKERMGHRTADWTDQVTKGVEDLCEVAVFEYKSGRTMPGATDYKRNDIVDFKGLRRHVKRYNKELAYYIKDTF